MSNLEILQFLITAFPLPKVFRLRIIKSLYGERVQEVHTQQRDVSDIRVIGKTLSKGPESIGARRGTS